MRTLAEHKKNPLNFNRPVYFTLKSNFFDYRGECTLYIDFDGTEKIRDLYYTTPEANSFWAPYLSVLAEKLKGKDLQSTLGLGLNDFHEIKESTDFKDAVNFPPLSFVKKMVQDYLGEDFNYQKLSDLIGKDLICRCFAVTKEDIALFVTKNDISSVKAVTDFTMAGGGCATCIKDIKSIINEFGDHMIKGKYRPLGMTPIQFVLKLSKFLEDLEKELSIKIEIINFKRGILTLKKVEGLKGKLISIKESIFKEMGIQIILGLE